MARTENSTRLIWEHKKGENPFAKYTKVRTLATNSAFEFDVVSYRNQEYAMKFIKIGTTLAGADSVLSLKQIRNEAIKIKKMVSASQVGCLLSTQRPQTHSV